jgi:hypothetical protein
MRCRLGHFVLMCALVVPLPLTTVEAKDLSRKCTQWTFEAEGGAEGEPAASLACGNDSVFAVQCAGDFMGNLRYYAEAAGDDYTLFKFKIGAQSFEVWLRPEEMDGASAGYQEFDHPLFKALAKSSGSVEITDVAGKKTDSLPLKGFSSALASLRKACEGEGQ